MSGISILGMGASSNALYINGSNVGVGTSNPTTALQVAGTVTATGFAGPLTGNVTGTATGLSGTPNITAGTTTATSLGIGKTAAYPLDVSGSINFTGSLTQNGTPYTTNYTATAPLSMSGNALTIANATTSAPGVVQVGSGLSVSSGVVSATQALKAYGVFTTTTIASGSHPSTIGVWTAANSVTPVGITVGTVASQQNQFTFTNAGTYHITATYEGYNTGTSANSIKLYLYASGATIGTTTPLQQTSTSYASSGGYLCNIATVTTIFTVSSTNFVLASIEVNSALSTTGTNGTITIMQIA